MLVCVSCFLVSFIDYVFFFLFILFFKQNTAYEVRISDWSSDVCSSDLIVRRFLGDGRGGSAGERGRQREFADKGGRHDVSPVDCQIGRASCRERVCQYV